MKYFIFMIMAFNLAGSTFVQAETLSCTQLFASSDSQKTEIDPKIKNKLIVAYTKAAKEKGALPTLEEVAKKMGVSSQEVSQWIGPGKLFNTLRALTVESYKANKKAFEDVRDTDYFTAAREEQTLKVIQESPSILVTTAVSGCEVDMGVFNDLLRVAKEKNAPILVFPAEMKTSGLDPVLLNTPNVHIITNTIQLGDYLTLLAKKIPVLNSNPLSGIESFGKRGESQIVGSPKMYMKTIATYDNHIISHMMYTTGAITKPDYNKSKPSEKVREAKAKMEHRYGALILEKSLGSDRLINAPMNGFFHVRQIKYDPVRKGMMDLNTFYSESEVRQEKALALVYGDFHFGETDRDIEKSLREDILENDPDYVVAHDSHNGKATSRWDVKNYVLMNQKAKEGQLDVKKELLNDVASFNSILSINKTVKIVVVVSNHDTWLSRWVKDRAYMDDPYNSDLGDELALFMKQNPDVDPYAYFILKHIDDSSRIIFLEAGDSFKVGAGDVNIELAIHGDKGANGAKGSFKTYQLGTDGIVFGHTHSPEIKNETINAGLSAKKVLDYIIGGLSNWNQGKVRVSLGGIGQFIQFQHGEWHAHSELSPIDLQNFFPKGFPQVIPVTEERQKNQKEMESTLSIDFDAGQDVDDLDH